MEQYLQQKHSENYTGTDDDMPDAFESWLGNMQVDDLIKYADELTQQALAEERERVRGTIKESHWECPEHGLPKFEKTDCVECNSALEINVVLGALLSSLDKEINIKK